MTNRDWAVDAAEDAMLLMQSPVIGEDGKMVHTDAEIMQVIAARIRTHSYAQEPTDANLSQPQPVAQGEAVAWMVEREQDATFPRLYEHESAADRLIKSVTIRPMPTKRPLYATPTIPTGHRVVPVEPTEEMVSAAIREFHKAHKGLGAESMNAKARRVIREVIHVGGKP